MITVELLQNVISGKTDISELTDKIDDFEGFDFDISNIIKYAYKIGHSDAKHDAAEMVVDDSVNCEDSLFLHNSIMNIKSKCEL